ncbi:MAG: RagB/SusD family nutrient uptake outer membrane protein [Bacteroidales bacterium]|nr:RagB/SusD family nutrient uptake outer membrane protein [Bacteroidales bacterium]
MKNILKNILIGSIAATLFCSCNLDLVPTTSIAYDEGTPLFLNENDVRSFQNGVLTSYRSLQYGVFTQTSDIMCDYFNATVDFGNNYGAIHRAGANDSFNASTYETEDMWQNHYYAIKNYNIVIANAALVEDETLLPSVDILKGIALFCRASSYLTLARYYGNAYDPATAATDLCVPLVLVYDQLEKPARATVKQVYDQIIKDLDEAESLLAEVPGAIGSEVPTIDAVYALKARYYLDVQDYDEAYTMALNVIGSEAGYTLANTAEAMLAEYVNDAGTEPIIQLYASIAEGAKSNGMYAPVRKDDTVGKYFSPNFVPTKTLINSYSDGDLRFQTWYSKDMYPIRMGANYYDGVYVFIKYYDNPALRSGPDETGAKAAKPLMISEMYLIAAEAAAQNQSYDDAKTILNALQLARKTGFTEGTLEDVKKEWYRETVGEGLRFSCAKRWGESLGARPSQTGADYVVIKGAEYDERTLSADSYVWNWPVPTYEMKLNGNLVQNDGYSAQ